MIISTIILGICGNLYMFCCGNFKLPTKYVRRRIETLSMSAHIIILPAQIGFSGSSEAEEDNLIFCVHLQEAVDYNSRCDGRPKNIFKHG